MRRLFIANARGRLILRTRCALVITRARMRRERATSHRFIGHGILICAPHTAQSSTPFTSSRFQPAPELGHAAAVLYVSFTSRRMPLIFDILQARRRAPRRFRRIVDANTYYYYVRCTLVCTSPCHSATREMAIFKCWHAAEKVY